MRKISLTKKRMKLPILAFIFIVLSIPLAIYALLNLDSFDTRNRASNDLETNICNIKFPYVNPSSIEVGKTVQVQIDANTPEDRIRSVSVMNQSGEIVFEKSYEDVTVESISELFTFKSNDTGSFGMLGTLITTNGSKPCVVEDNKGITVLATNLAPEFKTLPISAKPSNAIKVNDTYEYTLIVEDNENDTINYSYSFTPNSDWLKYTILEDGRDGRLTIKFTGKPDVPASYLANIFVHDGYNQHLRAQSWVINVDQDVNDNPKVTVYEPSSEVSVTQGQTVKISWEAEDLNQISKYELFLSTNPANPNTWIPVNENISSKVGHYILDTSKIAGGTYQAVVRATDNYSPPATGVGVSGKIVINGVKEEEEETDPNKPDDGVILVDPQIINISPSKGSKLKNRKATVSATLIAGTGSEIVDTTLVAFIDDKDITKDLKINQISKSEFTIVYSPKDEYKLGTHKVNVRFKDNKGGLAQKDWTFEIIEDSEKDEETVNLFGYDIPKRTAMIVGGGIALLLLAIFVPWILYLLWRGSKDDDYETVYNTTYSPIKPSSDNNEEKEIDVNVEGDTNVTERFTSPTPSEKTDNDNVSISNTTLWTPTVAKEEEVIETEESKKEVENVDQSDTQEVKQEPILQSSTLEIKQEPVEEVPVNTVAEVIETTSPTVEDASQTSQTPDQQIPLIQADSSDDSEYVSEDIIALAEQLKNSEVEEDVVTENKGEDTPTGTPSQTQA